MNQRDAGLLEDLTEAREAWRLEQARDRALLAKEHAELEVRQQRIQNLRSTARTERLRARTIFKRYLRKMKSRWSFERRQVEFAREQLQRDQQQYENQSTQTQQRLAQQQAELNEYKTRLTEAWQLLAENQKRLLNDRQQAESHIRQQGHELDRREREAALRDGYADEQRLILAARVNALNAEIESLEARATQSRINLRQLEERRNQLASQGQLPAVTLDRALVSLEAPKLHPQTAHDAEHLLGDIQSHHQAALRDRSKLAVLRSDLDRREADLMDQRAVLAEHVAALAAARDQWQSSEQMTLAELEHLAGEVRLRENELDERERRLAEAERRVGQREYELWHLQERLDAWQGSFAALEANALAKQQFAEQDVQTKRDQLRGWEQSLEGIVQTWGTLREQERQTLTQEVQAWQHWREQYSTASATLQQSRVSYLELVSQLAPKALAWEALNKADARRMRVLQKRWESRFGLLRRECEKQNRQLTDYQQLLVERTQQLTTLATTTYGQSTLRTARQFDEERSTLVEARQVHEQQVFQSQRELRLKEAEREIDTLREAMQRLTQQLVALQPEPEPDIIPLSSRHRAA